MRQRHLTLWLCFLFSIVLFCGTATPALADTSGPYVDSFYPTDGQVLPSGPMAIQVRVLDADTIDGSSVNLSVNGQKVPAILSYDVLSIDPVTETEVLDYTHAMVSYRMVVTDATYNVGLSIKDQLGNLTTKQ